MKSTNKKLPFLDIANNATSPTLIQKIDAYKSLYNKL